MCAHMWTHLDCLCIRLASYKCMCMYNLTYTFVQTCPILCVQVTVLICQYLGVMMRIREKEGGANRCSPQHTHPTPSILSPDP